jgi:RNA polymerase primary sigma factor
MTRRRLSAGHEQLNAVMPSEEVTSEQIEDILAALNEMGINVVETAEAEARETPGSEETESGELVEVTPKTPTKYEGVDRAHRRPGAHVSARDGLDRAALAPGRGRHRQAY